MGTKLFRYAPEKGKNPYMGFTSFQHFNGEKLYSDIVVRPEANMCETEPVEVFPVSPDASETEDGFYPASTVAYIRILWKDFEPVKGQYRNDFIEQILSDADAHGQTVMLRLMAHSTRWQDDVPAWLKQEIDCPERPDGMRVKDSPTDPRFIHYFCEAVRALGRVFDRDLRLNCMDVSLPGSWGEGHKVELYSEDLLHELMDAYLDSFPRTHLIVQSGQPALARYCMARTNVGLRCDGIGLPGITYSRAVANYGELVSDVWQKAPISIETYWWLGEWVRQGWDIEQIFDLLLSWHISTFNAKSIDVPKKLRPMIARFEQKMGYHFMPLFSDFPDEAFAGDSVDLSLTMFNRGVAPIYEELPVTLRLKNSDNEFFVDLPFDMRTWLPGAKAEKCTIMLPDDLVPGIYSVGISFGSLYLCTDAPVQDGFTIIGETFIHRPIGKNATTQQRRGVMME